MHVQQQEGDKKVIDYDDLDNSQAVRNIWGQWGFSMWVHDSTLGL